MQHELPDYYYVPESFLRKYMSLLEGPYTLSTIEALKEFWLFAVNQGLSNYDARDFIARITVEVTLKSPAMQHIRTTTSAALSKAYDMWNMLEYVGEAPKESKESNEEFSNCLWRELKELVEAV